MKNTLTILAIGDVIGRSGRMHMYNSLQAVIDQYSVDFVIVNGENAAGGRSITEDIFREFLSSGVNVVTSGNHIFDNRDIDRLLQSEKALLRPANYPPGTSGQGYGIYDIKGNSVCVINLLGRTFMDAFDCPFRLFDEIYEKVKDTANIIIVDFHGETTSEKRAFGWYVDGRASLVFGTHTHVMTADEEILPGGTGFITDIGMTGSFNSVIGMSKEQSIERFLTQIRQHFTVASGNEKMNAIIVDIQSDGITASLKRLIK